MRAAGAAAAGSRGGDHVQEHSSVARFCRLACDDGAAVVAQASGPWLESLAAAGLVDAVDAFCENIAFSLAETEPFISWGSPLPSVSCSSCCS